MTTIRSVSFLLICLLPASVSAQELPDPTRPPMEIGDGSGWSAQRAAPETAKGLLSVIISPSRCAAIIDGKMIRLGEKYGDATLVVVAPHGVVLQGVHGRRNMELFPGVKVTAPQPVPQPPTMCILDDQQNMNQKSGKKTSRQMGLKKKKQ